MIILGTTSMVPSPLFITPNPTIKVMLCVDLAWILKFWMVTSHRMVFHSWLVAPESCHWLGQAWTHDLGKTNEQEREQESGTFKQLESLTMAETHSVFKGWQMNQKSYLKELESNFSYSKSCHLKISISFARPK